MDERLGSNPEQSRELHEALAQLANSAKQGNTELVLQVEYARECSQCKEVVVPDVEHTVSSVDYDYHDVTWSSKCGEVGVIEVGWDLEEEAILDKNKSGCPENFSQKPSFLDIQRVFEQVTSTKLTSTLEQLFTRSVRFDTICREVGVSVVPAVRELANAGFELKGSMRTIEPDEAITTYRTLEQMRLDGVIRVVKRLKA